MKKNLLKTKDDYEIDLIELIKNLWRSKFKIIIITIISFLIGVIYTYQKPLSYETSLQIKASRSLELNKLLVFEDFINDNRKRDNSNEKLTNNRNEIKFIILDKFINELNDSKKLINNLKNITFLKKDISQLTEEEQEAHLYRYTELFTIKKSLQDPSIYNIKFNWDNALKGKEILRDVLNTARIEVAKNLYNELVSNINIIKNKNIQTDLREIEYLVEQLEIAKSLKISNEFFGKINIMTFKYEDEDNFKNRLLNDAYYLRGEVAIQKEIDTIKNRKYDYLNDLIKQAEFFKTQNNIDWVNYNLFEIKSSSNSKTIIILISSILLGLIIGIIYVLISNMRRF